MRRKTVEALLCLTMLGVAAGGSEPALTAELAASVVSGKVKELEGAGAPRWESAESSAGVAEAGGRRGWEEGEFLSAVSDENSRRVEIEAYVVGSAVHEAKAAAEKIVWSADGRAVESVVEADGVVSMPEEDLSLAVLENEAAFRRNAANAITRLFGGLTDSFLSLVNTSEQYMASLERRQISLTEESYLSNDNQELDGKAKGTAKDKAKEQEGETGDKSKSASKTMESENPDHTEDSTKETSKKSTKKETSKKSTENETSKKSTENETSKKPTENEKSKKSTENETSKKSAENETSKKSAENETSKKSAENETSKKSTEKETENKDKSSKNKTKSKTASKQELSYQSYILPEYSAYHGFKTYEPYRAITSRSTPQWKLQQVAETDEHGLRTVDGRICVAIGSYFRTEIGQYFDLVLENGTVIPCIKGDEKSDRHTDEEYHIFTVHSGCCSEFLVDAGLLREYIGGSGDVSKLYSEWESPVVEIRVYQKNYFKN